MTPELSIERLLLATDIASRCVVKCYTAHAEDGAPSFAQGAALLLLGRNDGATPSQLAQGLILAPSGVTTLVRRLESAGYVTRAAHKRDKRAQRLSLTDAGRAAMLAYARGLKAAEAEATATLNPAERAAVLKFFTALTTTDDDNGL